MLIFKRALYTFKPPKVLDGILRDEKSDRFGLQHLAVLYRPAMTRTPCQRWSYYFHGLAQFVLQGERRIDHKHATGRQASRAAIGIAADGQGEVDPRLLSVVA